MFSNKALKEMIIPLFVEQFLVMLVGLADTFVISQYIGKRDTEHAGEAASQLLLASVLFSVVISAVWLLCLERIRLRRTELRLPCVWTGQCGA